MPNRKQQDKKQERAMARNTSLKNPAAADYGPYMIGHRPSRARKPEDTTRPPARTGQASEMWQRIRAVLAARNLRQQDVADVVGRSRAAVGMWIVSDPLMRTTPSVDALRKLATLAKVPMTFFTDDSYSPNDVYKFDGTGGASHAANDHEPIAQPPLLRDMLGMADQRAMGFWSAVEFDVCERKAARSECFTHPSNGAAPDFVCTDNLVVFASDNTDPRSMLICAMSILLSAERQTRAQIAKHVLVFDSTGQARTKINEAEAERQFGAAVRVFASVADASKYLRAL